MKTKKILVLGNFGYKSGHLDGQTVKTRNVYELLVKESKHHISYFDTECLDGNKLLLFKLLLLISNVNSVVYLPAKNNLTYFLPIIDKFSKLLSVDIHYFIVGGWLPVFLEKKPGYTRYLKRISTMFSETQKMKSDLINKFDLQQVFLFPNFRQIDNKQQDIERVADDEFRIVFVSRIMLKKGIDTLFNLIKHINSNVSRKVSVTFFGPIVDEDKDFFFSNLFLYENVKYEGVLKPETIPSVLVKFDLFVLPTRYEGEGCPGAIIDAYMSSLPVIASDWKYNSEFIDHGKTGFLFPLENENLFYTYCTQLINDNVLLQKMKKAAFEKSKEYSSEKAVSILNNHTNLLK